MSLFGRNTLGLQLQAISCRPIGTRMLRFRQAGGRMSKPQWTKQLQYQEGDGGSMGDRDGGRVLWLQGCVAEPTRKPDYLGGSYQPKPYLDRPVENPIGKAQLLQPFKLRQTSLHSEPSLVRSFAHSATPQTQASSTSRQVVRLHATDGRTTRSWESEPRCCRSDDRAVKDLQQQTTHVTPALSEKEGEKETPG